MISNLERYCRTCEYNRAGHEDTCLNCTSRYINWVPLKELKDLIIEIGNLHKFIGSVLDAYDLLPNDIKSELEEEDLGKILEKKLQETDL